MIKSTVPKVLKLRKDYKKMMISEVREIAESIFETTKGDLETEIAKATRKGFNS